MDDRLTQIVERARERFPLGVSDPVYGFGETSVDVARDRIADVCRVMQPDLEMLADWSAVDYLGVNPPERRFLCAAVLASVRSPLRLRLRAWVPEGDERCPTLTLIWPGANFLEREMFDFFGIDFEGHPNMRRLFMPDEWEGHPQRKDYPLGGRNVEYHNGAFIPPPDLRSNPTSTSGYPGRIS
jgi:NADH-quinone oxidoreductase subunit C